MRPDQFLRALIASSDDAIVGTNLDGVVFFWNEAAERLYGYASSEVLGRNISLLVPPERSEELRHLLEETRQGKAFHGFETERLRRDGTRVPLTLSMSPIHGSDGSVIGTVRTGQDQSERSRLTAAIHRSEKQAAESLSVLDILQSAAPIGFSFVDCDFRFLRVNEKAAAINGLSVEEHLGRTMAEVIPQFWPQLERAYKRVLRRGEPLLDVEVSSETAEDPGRVHSWIESLYPVRVDGEIIGVGAVFVDITERKEAERIQLSLTDALRHQALHDSLTGLPNRALIMDRAEQMLARGRRHKMGTAVLYLDIDNFKDINDTLGHQVGDQLLMELGDRLVAVLRDTDTVGRIGGDEFVVLMESPEEVIEPAGSGPLEGGAPGATAATLIAERILAVLREPFDLGGSLYSITASIGIAAGPRDSAGDLLRDADVALYEAKACGKQRFVLFHPAMQRAAESHLELQMDLRAAVERDEFFLVYQPIFDIDTEGVVGLEVLLRWQHPVRGTVMPNDFIPMLEEDGLIVRVGRRVLRLACEQAARWRDMGFSLPISVNVSPRQLDSPGLLSDITEALAASDLDPRQLVVEITESTLMRDPEAAVERIKALKGLGVSVAVDDFGTGYSSLAYLRSFPVDILKIDRSFIAGITASQKSSALIHTLVQLGKVLGLDTVAEGIEEKYQLERLRDEQCDTGQGFLYARPLRPEDLEAFLETHMVLHDKLAAEPLP